MAGLLVRLRPVGPWRYGSASGQRRELDPLYRSDSLYSALTGAIGAVGDLEAWLDATARAAEPEVRLCSCFPWMEDTLFVTPPRNVWPPPAAKLRAKGVRFVPASLISDLLAGTPLDESKWQVDAPSGCLLPAVSQTKRVGPLRQVLRTGAAVDRMTRGHVAPHASACVEFAQDAGLWTFAAFSGPEAQTRWEEPLKAAFRLLADSGFGGRRSIGWGRSEQPVFQSTNLEDLFPVRPAAPAETPVATPAPETEPAAATDAETEISEVEQQPEPAESPAPAPAPIPAKPAYWLLSLFCPTESEASQLDKGSYTLVTRAGRVDSPVEHGAAKKKLRMLTEGSVLLSDEPPMGTAPNVAPDGFPHPVYRYGIAVSLPIPAEVTP